MKTKQNYTKAEIGRMSPTQLKSYAFAMQEARNKAQESVVKSFAEAQEILDYSEELHKNLSETKKSLEGVSSNNAARANEISFLKTELDKLKLALALAEMHITPELLEHYRYMLQGVRNPLVYGIQIKSILDPQ